MMADSALEVGRGLICMKNNNFKYTILSSNCLCHCSLLVSLYTFYNKKG